MPRKVLVAGGEAEDRAALRGLFHGTYEVIEALDGREALTLLHTKHRLLSAAVLEVDMPELDGLEVLRLMRQNAVLFQLPVIITADASREGAEAQALAQGANDFFVRPFRPSLLLHSLRNAVNLRESAAIINAIQHDKLTGLYNREAFFEKAAALIKDHEAGYYVMSCFDVDNFKLVNDRYGAEEGDRLLRQLGRLSKACFDAVGGISARISADNFAALFPYGSGEEQEVAEARQQALDLISPRTPIVISVGRCVARDVALPVSALYDRAFIAKQSVKGRYDSHVAYFTDSMRQKLLTEQAIIGDMDAALNRRQFEVWFQPKVNHATGALIGAEALVRWRHPEKGILPPDTFLPVFEQSGFIYEMDKAVWDQACACLRGWLDEGLAPCPVSVNVSRYDLFRSDLLDVIGGLLEKYRIPSDLLRLEITESAFARASGPIIGVVEKLMKIGLTMEIDDFGSGYSSLNTLKDVPAHTLKLDMRFLEDKGDARRGGNILQSVVRMARWLGMSVIAEGVETREQADFLQSIGCNHVQGYLYAKPMPAEEYGRLLRAAVRGEMVAPGETSPRAKSNTLWDPESFDTLLFNRCIGGACILEAQEDRLELLRVNDAFALEIGGEGMTAADALSPGWVETLDEESFADLLRAARLCGENRETRCEVRLPPRLDKKGDTRLSLTLRQIAVFGDRRLLYCGCRGAAERGLRAVLDALPEEVAVVAPEGEGLRLLYANTRYFAARGGGRRGGEPLSSVAMEDRRPLLQALTDGRDTLPYRLRLREGRVRRLRGHVTALDFPGADGRARLLVTRDADEPPSGED